MWKTIILITLAVLYALNPYDILPDLFVGWGWLDDLVVLGLLWRYLIKQKKTREAFRSYGQSDQGAHDNANQRTGSGDSRSHADTDARQQDPYKVLGLARGASEKDIKQAYRRLATQYHPDKVAHLGDEFKELAEKRFREIQEAYEVLRGQK